MLEQYLSTKTNLQAARIRTVFAKLYRRSDNSVVTMQQLIEDDVKRPNSHLDFSCGTSKKRNGLRCALKPEWCLMGDDPEGGTSGSTIPKYGAIYANMLLGNKHNIEEMEALAMKDYNENSRAAEDKRTRNVRFW